MKKIFIYLLSIIFLISTELSCVILCADRPASERLVRIHPVSFNESPVLVPAEMQPQLISEKKTNKEKKGYIYKTFNWIKQNPIKTTIAIIATFMIVKNSLNQQREIEERIKYTKLAKHKARAEEIATKTVLQYLAMDALKDKTFEELEKIRKKQERKIDAYNSAIVELRNKDQMLAVSIIENNPNGLQQEKRNLDLINFVIDRRKNESILGDEEIL